MKIVIIGRNEAVSIMSMYNALCCYPYKRVWILDRCTDLSKSILKTLNEEFYTHDNEDKVSRFTSTCRNIGYTKATNDETEMDDILFIDGDRFPVFGDLKELESSTTDVTLLKLETDMRDQLGDYKEVYGGVYNFFFSCGIFIRKDACLKIHNFYKEHPEDYGQSVIFPQTVEKEWGIEDTHLGDICYHLGLTCDINPNIKLHGTFTRGTVSTLDVIEHRFRLRQKLNCKW